MCVLLYQPDLIITDMTLAQIDITQWAWWTDSVVIIIADIIVWASDSLLCINLWTTEQKEEEKNWKGFLLVSYIPNLPLFPKVVMGWENIDPYRPPYANPGRAPLEPNCVCVGCGLLWQGIPMVVNSGEGGSLLKWQEDPVNWRRMTIVGAAQPCGLEAILIVPVVRWWRWKRQELWKSGTGRKEPVTTQKRPQIDYTVGNYGNLTWP